MPSLATPPPFEQTLPSLTFERLQRVFRDTARSLKNGEFLSTVDLENSHPDHCFAVVTSKSLSALLTGTACNGGSNYDVQLTFDPNAIALFLTHLRGQQSAQSPCQQAIDRSVAALGKRANIGSVQSRFTIQLLQVVAEDLNKATSQPTAAVCQPIVDAALHQQVAQERLVNHVAVQTLQGLELPIIIETALEQVRTFLKTDRLVIYQLMAPETHLSTEVDPHSNGSASTQYQGRVTYESLASSKIPSVLDYQEQYCWDSIHECRAKYSQGFTLAIDDITHNYTASDCLLKFLHSIQVRAKLVKPIIVKSHLWGLIIAHQCSAPRHWQEHEKDLLQCIGEHLAIAIYQAQLYQQLQAQKQTLEEQVKQRTQELHGALLATQSANQVKGDFLATMSHELRTPLTCVIGLSATLLRWSLGPLTDKQRGYLQTIHDNGEHLLDLINDILELSQMESGIATLNLSEFSLSSLVQQSLQTFRDKALRQKVVLKSTLNIPPERDRFVADPRRVRQILYNLLDNAIKFTPAEGKVTLRVWVEPNAIVLQVEDSGIGIPTNQQSQLFQAFQQLDTSYRRNYEGTGLGLALVKQLVDLHQGKIEVSSIEGQGSTFTVQLPHQSRTGQSNLADFRGEVASPRGRIILIEPHEDIAVLICDMLTAAGHQVVWLVEASTAMKQIQLLHPVAVIMDFQSQDKDSHHLIQQLRQLQDNEQTKIILLSTQDTLKEQQQIVAEVDACLIKPIDPERLVYKLDQLLGSMRERVPVNRVDNVGPT